MPEGLPLWRAFPWDPSAPGGAPFSAQSAPPTHLQTQGRFDLGAYGGPAVLYLAETRAHAVAERLRGFTGRPLRPAMLRQDRRRLALVKVVVPDPLVLRLADLTDPLVLAEYRIPPDALASDRRARTQGLSRAIYERGVPGFRWWSAIHGDWHTVVLFLDRVPLTELEIGTPRALTPGHAAVREAARVLRMPIPAP